MNTKWLKKFKKKALGVKLTAHDKRVMLSRILGPAGIPSPYSFFLTFMEYRHKIVVAAVLVAFVLTSGGTSFAAASALPGEALYSIKVNVNEEIQSFVAVSPDAKVKVEVKRTETRLKEAETLSKEGRLNEQTKAIIETHIEKHSESIKENIAELALENATTTVQEVIEDLEDSIEEHEAVLSSTSSEHIDDVISKVKEVKEEIETIAENVAGTSTEATSTPESATSTTPISATPASAATTTVPVSPISPSKPDPLLDDVTVLINSTTTIEVTPTATTSATTTTISPDIL